ncbi:hypothetical protein KO481_12545 [Nocardia sp. NEAU-G5]|uniref:Uncharacterized protein n=1 Tax=Nocardia albiluteola TaxID=2842303 RepID=A0ABS6AWD2_9NOCA|nr:hypothetical protein [Nocardia albiluteola]MBU3062352.1 hypothetical protein [Nocardia albiluteola]
MYSRIAPASFGDQYCDVCGLAPAEILAKSASDPIGTSDTGVVDPVACGEVVNRPAEFSRRL